MFLINFTRIMWFFWDLGLTFFDIPKNVVFPEMLVLSNIFGFMAVNLAPKWTITVNFGCISFDSKVEFLKDLLNTMFILLDN